MSPSKSPIILCELREETKQRIDEYTDALQKSAAQIGDHGLTDAEFWDSGLFRSAIEKIRGTQAATMEEKRGFVESILDRLQARGGIQGWTATGSGERHDYEVRLENDRICAIETKGCLDGNNTNIFERPANADEFVIWSLCQNPGSDPAHNAWSGIHTRLSAEIIHKKQIVNGIIIWDMLCGTPGRPCPKLEQEPNRATVVGERRIPPPCIYLLPRTVPDPRNNPQPPTATLSDVSFLKILHAEFGGNSDDIVSVAIEAKMDKSTVIRKTVYSRNGMIFSESNWTKLKRARS